MLEKCRIWAQAEVLDTINTIMWDLDIDGAINCCRIAAACVSAQYDKAKPNHGPPLHLLLHLRRKRNLNCIVTTSRSTERSPLRAAPCTLQSAHAQQPHA